MSSEITVLHQPWRADNGGWPSGLEGRSGAESDVSSIPVPRYRTPMISRRTVSLVVSAVAPRVACYLRSQLQLLLIPSHRSPSLRFFLLRDVAWRSGRGPPVKHSRPAFITRRRRPLLSASKYPLRTTLPIRYLLQPQFQQCRPLVPFKGIFPAHIGSQALELVRPVLLK
ncbi:hypothetical protein AB6A40_001458 [Gnathostoma spinigerum]|uniref:Uncharacterized protein n=1 Tax=Gnathostoma spinigerum TaxID=75299 RepID=A0ABD6EBM4_9BILA